jgi:hypothetical protein
MEGREGAGVEQEDDQDDAPRKPRVSGAQSA